MVYCGSEGVAVVGGRFGGTNKLRVVRWLEPRRVGLWLGVE